LRGEDQGEGEKPALPLTLTLSPKGRENTKRSDIMSDITFGLTMTVAGMGITFITLYLLTLLIRLLNKLFPFKKEGEGKTKT